MQGLRGLRALKCGRRAALGALTNGGVARSDIYALGVTAFMAAKGRRPLGRLDAGRNSVRWVTQRDSALLTYA